MPEKKIHTDSGIEVKEVYTNTTPGSEAPKEAALDLNKHLLEMIAQNPKASLHGVVAEVLSFEAKKVMKQ